MTEETSKAKQTTWLTGIGLEETQDLRKHMERTQIQFPGQMEWYNACLSLEDPYFTKRVLDDMKMMMAHKGKRSDQVTLTLARSFEDDVRMSSGYKLHEIALTESIQAQNERKKRGEL